MKVLLITVLILMTLVGCLFLAKKEREKASARFFNQLKKTLKETFDEYDKERYGVLSDINPFDDLELFEEEEFDGDAKLEEKREQTESDMNDLEYTLKKEMTIQAP